MDGCVLLYHETFVFGIFALGNARAFGVAVLVENACFAIATLRA